MHTIMAATTNRFEEVKRLVTSMPYTQKERVKADAIAALQNVPFLEPKALPLTRSDGRASHVLALDGTVQTYYSGGSYQTPVCVFIPETYPSFPPIACLRPTPDMFVVPGHKHADSAGTIYLPYLSEWRPASSNIVDLLGMMASVFSEVPPLRTRTPGMPGPPLTSGSGMSPPLGYGAPRPPMPAYPPYSTGSGGGGGGGGGGPSTGAAYPPFSGMGASTTTGPTGGSGRGSDPFVVGASGFDPYSSRGGGGPDSGAWGAVTGGGSRPASTTTATMASSTPAPVSRAPPTEKERKAEIIRELTGRLQSQMHTLLSSIRDSLDRTAQAGEQLSRRSGKGAALVSTLAEQVAEMRKYEGVLDGRIGDAQAHLSALESKTFVHVRAGGGGGGARGARSHTLASSSGSFALTPSLTPTVTATASATGDAEGGGGSTGGDSPFTPGFSASTHSPSLLVATSGVSQTPPPPASYEELIVPCSALQTQLLEAVAEDAAIEDCYYHLDMALRARRIDAETLLRETRDLARRQFRARYLARKIDGLLSAAVAKKAAAVGVRTVPASIPASLGLARAHSVSVGTGQLHGGGGGIAGSMSAPYTGYPTGFVTPAGVGR